MSLLLEPNSASTVSGESQTQNHEHDLQSLTWQNIEIDENKKAVLKKAIEDIVNSTDDLPYQIIEAAKVVSKISSGINLLQNHKEDFERIMGRASILVVVLWRSYKKSKYQSSLIWPPPKLREVVDHLVETVNRIHKLIKRKFNLAKQIFMAYAVRDIGKFKKYERRLDSAAKGLEKRPSNIKINALLLEVFVSRAQRHDDADSELPDQPSRGDSLDKEDTQRTAVILAEGSNTRNKANAGAKSTNRKAKSDEENEVDQTSWQTKSKALERMNVHPSRKGKAKEITMNEDGDEGVFGQTKPFGRAPETIQTSEEEESSGNESKKKKSTMILTKSRQRLSQTSEDEESTVSEVPSMKNLKKPANTPTKARQRPSRISGDDESNDNEGPSKLAMTPTKAKQRPGRISEDEETNGNEGPSKKKELAMTPTKGRQRSSQVLGDEESNFNEGPSKKKKTRKPTMTPTLRRENTAPPQMYSFNNHGPGSIYNNDVGNIYNSEISNVGNNNSRNYYGRRKTTHAH